MFFFLRSAGGRKNIQHLQYYLVFRGDDRSLQRPSYNYSRMYLEYCTRYRSITFSHMRTFITFYFGRGFLDRRDSRSEKKIVKTQRRKSVTIVTSNF